MPAEKHTVIIPAGFKGRRLDQVLAKLFPHHSRSRLQAWLRAGYIRVNGNHLQQSDAVQGGEEIHIDAQYENSGENWVKEPIPLTVVFQDEAIIILNKPAGLVVHPGAGNREHTLVNALLYHFPELEQVPRAGIVQRLDKDTTGIMVIARTPIAHTYLVAELQKRHIQREYRALVTGTMTAGGTVTAPISRHRLHRKRMAINATGKPAVTHYRIIKKYPGHTFINIQLETGRTHQIRVHMAHIHYPIVGDPVYGRRRRLPKQVSESLRLLLQAFPRQALHASKLTLAHPLSRETVSWEVPLPEDMQTLLTALDNHVLSTQPG